MATKAPERLSGSDMSNLLAERGPIHVHVGATIIVEGTAPSYDLAAALRVALREQPVPRAVARRRARRKSAPTKRGPATKKRPELKARSRRGRRRNRPV